MRKKKDVDADSTRRALLRALEEFNLIYVSLFTFSTVRGTPENQPDSTG